MCAGVDVGVWVCFVVVVVVAVVVVLNTDV